MSEPIDLMAALEESLADAREKLAYDEHVRWLSRQSKRALREIVERWAREHGRRCVLGGPADWSHDELVSACVRIYRGEQP